MQPAFWHEQQVLSTPSPPCQLQRPSSRKVGSWMEPVLAQLRLSALLCGSWLCRAWALYSEHWLPLPQAKK